MSGLMKASWPQEDLIFDLAVVKSSICWQTATLRLSLVVEHVFF